MAQEQAGKGPKEGGAGRLAGAALWAGQAGLAAYFAGRGWAIVSQPWEEMGRATPWLAALPYPAAVFLGYLELACAALLILPALLRVFPALVQASACLLGALMLPSLGLHLARGEGGLALRSAAVALAAAAVAWGRHYLRPIPPRT